MRDTEAPKSEKNVLADTVAAYLRRAAEWMADYRDAFAKGRGTAANHLFYAGEASRSQFWLLKGCTWLAENSISSE